jgi:hypothetical protein
MTKVFILFATFLISFSSYAEDIFCSVNISNVDGNQISFEDSLTDISKSFFFSKRLKEGGLIIVSGFMSNSRLVMKLQSNNTTYMQFEELEIDDLSHYTRSFDDLDLKIVCE